MYSDEIAGQLTEHHSTGVEPTTVEEPANPGVLPEDGLVVGGEGLGPADGRLDPDLLQARHPVAGALDVDPEHVPVELVQAKREVFFDLAFELIFLNCEK